MASRSISDVAREYEVPRAAVAAVFDLEDVTTFVVGRARCVGPQELRRVAPLLRKLRARMRERRSARVAAAG